MVVVLNSDELELVYSRVYHDIFNKNAEFVVKYYSYAGLKSRIKLESRFMKKKFFIKLSDGFVDFPETFHVALAHILISKIMRCECPLSYKRIYRKWVNLESSENIHMDLKRSRGHSIKDCPEGKVYDLSDSFSRMNKYYFDGVLSVPVLKWGNVITSRKFGHYDPSNHVIHVSKTLDSENVPLFVVDFVMYHEMLHIVVGSKKKRCNRVVHSAEFRGLEKKYESFDEAKAFLEKLG